MISKSSSQAVLTTNNKPVLTRKQFLFVNNYVSNGFNAHEAARASGYSEGFAKSGNSSALLKRPQIKAVIERVKLQAVADQQADLLITYECKVKKLMRVVHEIIPDDLELPIQKKYVPEAIKALQELNKMQGHIAPDRRINMTVKLTKERLKDAAIAYDEF